MKRSTHPVPVFVIALESRPRSGALCDSLAHMGISFEIVKAADVRDVSQEALDALYDAPRAMTRVGRSMGRGEIGCALSHQCVYRLIVERRIPLALVLEEDAIPGPAFRTLWQESGALPEGIDVLSLYSTSGFVRRHPSATFAGCDLHEATFVLSSTVGYFVRHACAEALLRSNTRISTVADWPLDHRDMRQFLAVPMPVGHDDAGSTIASDRPNANLLGRFHAPGWFSALFHLTCLGYVLQPGRYEGPANYYRREIAWRLKRLFSSTDIDVRALHASRTAGESR